MNAEAYRQLWAESTDVSYGFCWCGCGGKTPIANQSARRLGTPLGEPRRYILGHNVRAQNFGGGTPQLSPELVDALRRLRRLPGVTNKDLARWIGVCEHTIGCALNRKRGYGRPPYVPEQS